MAMPCSSSEFINRTSTPPPLPAALTCPPAAPPEEGDAQRVYLSLGSNLGDREALLQRAIKEIAKHIGPVVAQSDFVETEPWGFQSPHHFLNACIAVETKLTPQDLLHETQAIERLLGRTTKTHDGVYTDRPIDIDILLYGHLRLETEELTLPHPRMLQRPFVIEPLRQIAPRVVADLVADTQQKE